MEKDENDLPYISPLWNSEKTFDVLSKIVDFFKTDDVWPTAVSEIFLEERAMLMFGSLNLAMIRFKGLKFYGIVPAPLYDPYQEEYVTAISAPHTLYSITTYSGIKEHCAHYLEAMGSASYRLVTPDLFSVTLQSKYASDEETGIMLDIIRESVVFDVGKVFAEAFNGLTYSIWRSCITNKDKNFASAYRKQRINQR